LNPLPSSLSTATTGHDWYRRDSFPPASTMSNRPALGRGSSWFDGPGARPILGEPGPSTAAASGSPPREDPSYGGSRGGGEGYHQHQPRVVGNPNPSAPPPHPAPAQPVIRRVGNKANVSSACGPCKRAHLACDPARPCKRCVNIGKEDQCEDVPVSLVAVPPSSDWYIDTSLAQEAWQAKGQQDPQC
jgi:hypothetical protein